MKLIKNLLLILWSMFSLNKYLLNWDKSHLHVSNCRFHTPTVGFIYSEVKHLISSTILSVSTLPNLNGQLCMQTLWDRKLDSVLLIAWSYIRVIWYYSEAVDNIFRRLREEKHIMTYSNGTWTKESGKIWMMVIKNKYLEYINYCLDITYKENGSWRWNYRRPNGCMRRYIWWR